MFSRWAIKKVCKFLLKKKLGQLILGDIDLNQLDVQLAAGTIQLSDLALNVDYINSKFGASSAIMVKEGSIGSLLVSMPWKGKGCQIELDELEIVLVPPYGDISLGSESSNTQRQNGNPGIVQEPSGIDPQIAINTVTNSPVDVHEGVKTIAKMVKWLLTSFNIKIKKLIIAFDPSKSDAKNIIEGICRTLVLRIFEVECGTDISDDVSLNYCATVDNFLGLSKLTNFVKFHGAVIEFLQMDGQVKNLTTPIVTGERGGFSGNLRLSIPWNNGSLDIRKVEADVYIDPLQLKFQPSSLKCFLFLWDIFKDSCKKKDDVSDNASESIYFNAVSQMQSTQGSIFSDIGSWKGKDKETVTDTMLPGSHLISDWVPSSLISEKQRDKSQDEPDFGASVDQFFECFDGLRNSQSALGSSGILNWTASVFTAITAASNLASGSLNIPSEQKHLETNLKATFAGVSFHFSFLDEDQNKSRPNSHVHYLSANFKDVLLVLQVSPREMNFETTVGHVELADHFSGTRVKGDGASIAKMQVAVENAISSFSSSRAKPYLNERVINVVKVTLLRTSGASKCQLSIATGPSRDSFTGPISFSLKLPPVILWVNFQLISSILDILKETTNSCETVTAINRPESYPSDNTLTGDIFFPNARIIFCFPFEESVNSNSYSSWNQFIALDFSSSKENVQPSYPKKQGSSKLSRSLNFNLGNLALFLITSSSKENQCFSAQKVLSATDDKSRLSVISMIWQTGLATGPWIARKAKCLATSEDLSSNKNKFMEKGYECASVSTVKDVNDFNTQTRKEIISSSAFVIRARLCHVVVTLASKEYRQLHYLLNQTVDWCKSVTSDHEESSVSQMSVHVELENLEIQVNVETSEHLKKSIQSELAGSWHSFKLQIHNFELLSVSNIGGLNNSSFLFVGHGEGNLSGSINELPNQDFHLISCSNLTAGRGDGEGSNVLSSRLSGSEIFHFSDSVNLFSHTTITVRCGTVVAIGGRLDWFESVSSFFILPSAQIEKISDKNAPVGSSFILKLVDIGLSYEPYVNSSKQYIAGLLSASAVQISNITSSDSTATEYKIRFQDLGLLLSETTSDNSYNSEHLRKIGYVKVAEEAHVEALVKTNCENGRVWDLECSHSHIHLHTCSDTTSGLIRLVGQLQQLFAPDLEETFVHLQARWNNAQQTQDPDNSPSSSQKVNLMDEICDDAFRLDVNSKNPQILSDSLPLLEPMPDIIEGYFLSNLHSLSDVKTKSTKEIERGKNGWYSDVSLRILENHVSEKCELESSQKLACSEVSCSTNQSDECGKIGGRAILKNINVKWRLYSGSDWRDSQRDVDQSLEIELCGMNVEYEVFPDGEIFASKLSLSVKDIRLNDNGKDAPWKLVLGYYQSKGHPREYTSKALKLNLEAVRPHPSIPIEEYRLRVALLPMRLHLHQSQLDFLISFFGGKNSLHDNSLSPRDSDELQQKTTVPDEALLPYFQKFDIWPLIVRVDYSPSRVDLAALRGGKYVELINLVPWKGVELQLKHVQALGVYGWGCVGETIIGEWLEDISQNQVHKLLKGLPPIRSLVSVGSGAAKMVSLPVKNYRKDHRLLKGMQRGTIAFLRSISLEAIGLGVHLAAGAHDVLLQAEYILTSVPPSVPWPVQNRANTNVRSNQPKDALQGIQQAYDSISDGLGKSASALVQTPLKRYQRGAGVGSALASAVQAAPAAAIAPASAAARAVHCALLGVRNSLDPEHKKESIDKYLGTN